MLKFIISEERFRDFPPPADGEWVLGEVVEVARVPVSEEVRIGLGEYFLVRVRAGDVEHTGEVGPYTWYDLDPVVGQLAWVNRAS